MELKVHQMIWFQSDKYSFYFWNQFKNNSDFSIFEPAEIFLLETEIAPQIW